MKNLLVGCDLSMNHGAVIIFEYEENKGKYEINFKKLIIITDNKKTFQKLRKNVKCYCILYDKKLFKLQKQSLYVRDILCEIDREMMKPKIKNSEVYVAIEDYAYSMHSSSVTSLAETIGFFKILLYECGHNIRRYESTSVKLFNTGKGNADKNEVKNVILEELKIETNLDLDLDNKSLFDITDAFAVFNVLKNEFLLKKGFIDLKSLPEHQIRVFNKVRKGEDTNLLYTDWEKGGNNAIS